MKPAELPIVYDNLEAFVLPLKDTVIYPGSENVLYVGTPHSMEAARRAQARGELLLLIARQRGAQSKPGVANLFTIGTLAEVVKLAETPKMPDDVLKVTVRGKQRAMLMPGQEAFQCTHSDPDLECVRVCVKIIQGVHPDETVSRDLTAYLLNEFREYAEMLSDVPHDSTDELLGSMDEFGFSGLVDRIADSMPFDFDQRQELLEEGDPENRGRLLHSWIAAEKTRIETEQIVRGRMEKQIEKNQREYYLNEQMKAIRRELGDQEGVLDDLDNLAARLAKSGMPSKVRSKAEHELRKLKSMPPMSPEATVVRSFLDWMLAMPWKKRTKLSHALVAAARMLDEDHYGLDEVKERIMEFLSVQRRVKKVDGPVLCLVGPPGVGKTSLGASIARATNRKFVRLVLGGVHEEAEIRGHRRTYIGSMPGRILQKMAKAGVVNPLFLLDEVDKMGMDYRGDPAAALLEVLDPEQNHSFNDHYLDIDYDLSETLFICTSNSMDIPPALLDRMEVIDIPGYTESEKINIAKKHLFPKQQKATGMRPGELEISDDAFVDLVRYYTREAGVRGLERELAKLCRKVVKGRECGQIKSDLRITAADLQAYNGVRKYHYGRAQQEDQTGLATGLAWTEMGGDLLHIEVALVPGGGQRIKTGSLGDVMRESIDAALTFVKCEAGALGLEPEALNAQDMHIHVLEGATPKEGPSAGIGVSVAMVSVLTDIPVRADVAMTGEITLQGRLLQIGGLKQKLLAAHRGGIKTVILPIANEANLPDVPDEIVAGLELRFVETVAEVLRIALVRDPFLRGKQQPQKALEDQAGNDQAAEAKDASLVPSSSEQGGEYAGIP